MKNKNKLSKKQRYSNYVLHCLEYFIVTKLLLNVVLKKYFVSNSPIHIFCRNSKNLNTRYKIWC